MPDDRGLDERTAAESEVRLLSEPRAIEVVYRGRVTAAVLAEVSGAALGLAREHDLWHVLSDCSAMESDPSIFSLYDLIELLSQLGVSRRYREALVIPGIPELREGFEFYENAMVNRGLEVRCFLQRDAALAWLATG